MICTRTRKIRCARMWPTPLFTTLVMIENTPPIRWKTIVHRNSMMRAELIGHLKPCVTDIYLHIDARMADYFRTHPYIVLPVVSHLPDDKCEQIAPSTFNYRLHSLYMAHGPI